MALAGLAGQAAIQAEWWRAPDRFIEARARFRDALAATDRNPVREAILRSNAAEMDVKGGRIDAGRAEFQALLRPGASATPRP
jgi:hypothetical protein